MRIGTDLEAVSRFRGLSNSDSFVMNNFTPKEIRYCFSHTIPEIHLAGIFAAKEAAIKSSDLVLNTADVEIGHESNGAPTMLVNGRNGYNVSISHTDELAIAVVIRDEKTE